MSRGFLIALACSLIAGFGSWQVAVGQETKTVAEHPNTQIDTRNIFNFHFEGKKKRGEFIELTKPDEGKGRVLVITKLDVRMRQSTRFKVVEHEKIGETRKGKPKWKKRTRRSELFSVGQLEQYSKWLVVDYNSLHGMKFEKGMRPAIEISFGGGDMAVYAEGYWSHP